MPARTLGTMQTLFLSASRLTLLPALICFALAGLAQTGPASNPEAMLAGSDVILQRPNLLPAEAMPLGNGSLGVAVWSADGMTVQLNRADTMPHRLSPGQVTVPGLARLISAPDYKGRLNLYDGEFVESGAGMTARVYVESATDTLVIAVTGADPATPQAASLRLWPPRMPQASTQAARGILAETWKDTGEPGASGLPFGSLAAITAEGRQVSASVPDGRTVTVHFLPDRDGSYTLRIAAPEYDGTRSPALALAGMLDAQPATTHRRWWHAYWQHANRIMASSIDGEAQYMANLRDLYLFYAAAEKGVAWPGSQAGIADMLSAVRDEHQWDPAAFWHWNLRMQVAANLTAGLPELNAPYFRLYRQNLENLETWTRRHMARRPGICVPETMRFNGMGIEYEGAWTQPATGLNCDAASRPYYNARTLSTGAEVSFWIWQQYLETRDLVFLRQNYLVMRESARFLLAYQKPGADGLLHTAPSNAHETQWDVTDPVTDLVGIRTLYTNTVAAAHLLGVDPVLAAQMTAALGKLPALPRTTRGKPGPLLDSHTGTKSNDVFASSYLPGAPQHNVENLGLEPVWPYGLLGADSALAQRTFADRPYPVNQDWSFDPIQAARLGLGSEVSGTLAKLTEHYQAFPNGLASWGGKSGEFYIEQCGVLADALSEALAQDAGGTLRIGPAVPPGWSMSGTVALANRSSVEVQALDGLVTAAVFRSGMQQTMHVADPWRHAAIAITDSASKRQVAQGTGTLTFAAAAGHTYLLHRAGAAAARPVPSQLSPATGPRHLGTRSIGLAAQREGASDRTSS